MNFYTPPKKKKKILKNKYFNTVTIVISADSSMPVIRGKWERLADGRVRARYTLDEYADCLELYQAIGDAKESS